MSTRSFTSTTFLHCFSVIISAVVTGLATVNFGILSIWINGSAGVLTLLYHLAVLYLNWRRSRATPVTRHGVTFKKLILSNVKMPITPSPTYSPPPYDPEKLTPNRRPSSHSPVVITIPGMTKGQLNIDSTIPSGVFYSALSLFAIIVLTLITAVGLFMTVELTIHGAKFLLPTERAKGMTFPWNIKVQKAQCTFLAVLSLLNFVMLVLCVKGRSAISKHEDEKREEMEYGFASPDSTHHPASQWKSNEV
ncbi:hypothetical protein D9756_002069 [Leucocoprinus leucothites]|uniref:Uncharacterized protein n=1 Tax=Leucocoprinus leucothites TaxID=201217 RepID=A0A8H5GC36_9AGAR|nr:hypothetical protein D9756_002069 [Leucoagaricus leucothites]